jgi:predicted amidohydrolase
MRVLLAAVDAQKGDLDGNLARHLAMLEQARAHGCDLAVFPEFSLTGSVDPRRHPERALSVDAEPVRALLQGTFRSGVAAVFGIAERAGPAFHITQVFGHGGRLGGVYRKRHLAEGEEDYSTGEGAGVFQLGAARFGVTLCAEGEVDFPWTDAAAGGAAVVLFCSAPGLHGRRTDERGWRDGHARWLSAGLGDAVRHARRLGVPVAMATQAGSTEDEDFPGLAALVSPAGEVARLPDWRPGCLVVEVAADVTVHPVREAVRCLVLDGAGRALLVRYGGDPGGGWWGPPGTRPTATRTLASEESRIGAAAAATGGRSRTVEVGGDHELGQGQGPRRGARLAGGRELRRRGSHPRPGQPAKPDAVGRLRPPGRPPARHGRPGDPPGGPPPALAA